MIFVVYSSDVIDFGLGVIIICGVVKKMLFLFVLLNLLFLKVQALANVHFLTPISERALEPQKQNGSVVMRVLS